MALSNAERQRKWIEKNRALHNLRRRKKNLGADTESTESRETKVDKGKGELLRPPPLSKIDELRALMEGASKALDEPIVKLTVYRNDYGQMITEAQWNKLQELKEKAKNGGYVIDEYSQ